jgi:hypothetical protein
MQPASGTNANMHFRVRPHSGEIAVRLRRLWMGGFAICWVGVLLFSLGLVGYWRTQLFEFYSKTTSEHGWSPLLHLLTPGSAMFVFGFATAVTAFFVAALVRVWRQQFRQLGLDAAAFILFAAMFYGLLQPGFDVRVVPLSREVSPWEYVVHFEVHAARSKFGYSILPSWLVMRVGDSELSYGYLSPVARLAWLPFGAFAASLVCVPAAILWPVRKMAARIEEMGGESATARPDRQCVARRMRRLLWLAAIVLVNAVLLEGIWMGIYGLGRQLDPKTAGWFSDRALYGLGGAVTVAAGAMLAAVIGLFLSRTWRFSLRWLVGAIAICAIGFGLVRMSLGERLSIDNNAVIYTLRYAPLPSWALEGFRWMGDPVPDNVAYVEVVRPLALWGPHSLPLLIAPLLIVPVLFWWPAQSRTVLPGAARETVVTQA